MANTLDEGLSYASAFDNVWKHIKEVVEQLKVGSHVQVGHCYHDGRWLLTSNNVRFPKLMSAAKFYAENHLQLTNVVAARAGRGIRELSALQGFSRSTIILWRPGATYTRIIELEADTRYRMYQEHDEWPQLRVLQLLMVTDTAILAEAGERQAPEARR